MACSPSFLRRHPARSCAWPPTVGSSSLTPRRSDCSATSAASLTPVSPPKILVRDAARAGHPWAEYFASPRHQPISARLSLAGRHRDATTFPAEISLSAIDNDEGILVAAAIRDVTARLRVKDLERSNDDLESFIYTVAHDLRTPLRALTGYSELLLEEYGEVLGEEGHGYAERIVSAGQQMGQRISYLLDLSRISRAVTFSRLISARRPPGSPRKSSAGNRFGPSASLSRNKSGPWQTGGLFSRSCKICSTTPAVHVRSRRRVDRVRDGTEQ